MTTAIRTEYPTIASLPNFYYSGHRPDWLVVDAENRDSDALVRSNFRVTRARLEATDPDGVAVERASHWACGYVDYLLVAPDSPALATMARIAEQLEDYPILDEDDYTALEDEDNHPTDRECYSDYCAAYPAECPNRCATCTEPLIDCPCDDDENAA